ncbi:MAG: 50S ribosomal protein L30 [Longimicrobiales bacterium]
MAEKKKPAARRLRITQRRSALGRPGKHRATLDALGLGRPRATVVRNDGPTIRGMIIKVQHLVDVEELEEGED